MVNRKVFHPSYPGAVLTMAFDDGDPVAAFIQNMGEGLSQKEWDAFIQEIRVRLNRELGKVFRGTISPDQFGDAIYQHLLGAHSVSVAAGRQKAGVLGMLSDEDKQVGFFHATQQGQFIDGYVKRIKEKAARYWDEEKGEWKKGVMNRDLQMYASRLRGTASIAFEAYSPDDAQFNWKLGIAEHCEDCINLAADSPHMKGELPVFPGDGGTDCKTNCKCHLVRDDGVACYKPDPGVGRWSEGGSKTLQPVAQGSGELINVTIEDVLPENESPLTPDKSPVSAAVVLPGTVMDSEIALALKVIDEVHVDGSLPALLAGNIEIEEGTATQGWYLDSTHVQSKTGKRIGVLSVSLTADRPMDTIAHEMGHAIESEVFGNHGLIVTGKVPQFKKVGAAIKKSEMHIKMKARLAEIKEDLRNPDIRGLSIEIRLKQQKKFIEYLLSPEELWARAYSQFIFRSSKRKAVSENMHDLIKNGTAQWQEEDFEPIYKAIRNAMIEMGWINE